MKNFWQNIEDNILAIVMLVMLALTCINVFARYVFLSSMPFVEELTPMGLVLLSIAGATVAAKRGAHLGLTILTDKMSQRGKKICTLAGDATGIIFGVIVFYFGIDTVYVEYILGFVTSSMQWPEWLFGITIPAGGLFLIVRYLQLFITHAKQPCGN